METRKRILDNSSQTDIAREVAEVLLDGGICIIPTDTLYGIVALEQFSESVHRIYDIKNRSTSKPFIRLIGRLDALSQYTNQKLPHLLGKYWPGPLTLIFEGKEEKTVAVRFPDAPFLTEVFSHLGGRGIVAPSANLSGKSNIFECDQIVETFQGLVHLIVCQEGGLKETKASTILDTTKKPMRVLRQGSLFIEEHEEG